MKDRPGMKGTSYDGVRLGMTAVISHNKTLEHSIVACANIHSIKYFGTVTFEVVLRYDFVLKFLFLKICLK